MQGVKLTYCSICVLLCAASATAADIYWDGTGSDWSAPVTWSTASGATTPDPVSAPGANDKAVFNITTVNAAQTVNLNGNQSASNLTFNNTGTTLLQVDGNNTDTRTLSLGSGGIDINSGAGDVTIGPGAAYSNEHVNVVLSTNQTWTVAGGSQLTLNDSVTGGHTLTKLGTGTLILNGAGNSFAELNVARSNLVLSGTSTTTVSGRMRASWGGVTWGAPAGGGVGSLTVQDSAVLTVNGEFGVGQCNIVRGYVNQSGGTVNLNGVTKIGVWNAPISTYTISGGTLNIPNSNAELGHDGKGYLYVNGGTVNARGFRCAAKAHADRYGSITLAGGTLNIGVGGLTHNRAAGYAINLNSGTLGSLAPWSTSMNITMGGDVDVDTTGGNISLSGTLSGTGGVAKVGSGTLTLSGINTYSGSAAASGGILRLDNSSCLSTNTDLYLSAGGTLDLNFTGTNVIRTLYVEGQGKVDRVYNSGNLPSYLTGSGNILPLNGIHQATVIILK